MQPAALRPPAQCQCDWRCSSGPRHAVRRPLSAACRSLGAANITAPLRPSHRPTCRGVYGLWRPRSTQTFAQQPQQQSGTEVHECSNMSVAWDTALASSVVVEGLVTLRTCWLIIQCILKRADGIVSGITAAMSAACSGASRRSDIWQVWCNPSSGGQAQRDVQQR